MEIVHSKITMKDAEKLLRNANATPGTFILRRRNQDEDMPLALSLTVDNGKFEHYLVEVDNNGAIVINRTALQQQCYTVSALVRHLSTYADVISHPLTTCVPPQ